MASPFEILQIDADADDQAIKQAYRERIKEAHPDHGGSPSEFQRVRAAYEDLKTGEYAESDVLERGADVVESGDDAEPTDEQEAFHARVEYLNYEILDDHGWAVDDTDLFDKASAAGLDATDYGHLEVESGESLLEAAEREGFAWPFACRGGACANCAIVVLEGEMTTRVDHVLPPEMLDRGIQLSCNGIPTTDELRVLYNVKHLPDLEDLLLPPRPFKQAHDD